MTMQNNFNKIISKMISNIAKLRRRDLSKSENLVKKSRCTLQFNMLPRAKLCGICFGIGLFCNFAFSWQSGFILAIVCAVMLIIATSSLFTKSAPDITVDLQSTRVEVGGELFCNVTIINNCNFASPQFNMHLAQTALSMRTIESDKDNKTFLSSIYLEIPRLRPGKSYTKAIRLPTEKRMSYKIGPIKLAKTDIWQIFERFLIIDYSKQIFVYPKIHYTTLQNVGEANDFNGYEQELSATNGWTLHSLRGYLPGDSLKNVQWKSSAKFDKLIVKQYEKINASQNLYIIDYSLQNDEFENALTILSSIMLSDLQGSNAVILVNYNEDSKYLVSKLFDSQDYENKTLGYAKCLEILSQISKENVNNAKTYFKRIPLITNVYFATNISENSQTNAIYQLNANQNKQLSISKNTQTNPIMRTLSLGQMSKLYSVIKNCFPNSLANITVINICKSAKLSVINHNNLQNWQNIKVISLQNAMQLKLLDL